MRQLHMQLASVHRASSGDAHDGDEDHEWGGYDDEHDTHSLHEAEFRAQHTVSESVRQHAYEQAEERTSRSQLMEEHLQYFNDQDEKATQSSYEPSATVSVDGDDQKVHNDGTSTVLTSSTAASQSTPKSATVLHTAEQKVPATPASSPSRSVSSGPQLVISTSTSRSFERSDSESSAKFASDSAAWEGANQSPPPPPAPSASPSPGAPRSPLARAKSMERINIIADGVSRARTSQDLCAVFEISTRSIFDGGTLYQLGCPCTKRFLCPSTTLEDVGCMFAALTPMFTRSCMLPATLLNQRVFILVLCGAQTDRLKKKFSTDFMAKDSAVWIDPQKRSLHW
jgi:hypothetical protein